MSDDAFAILARIVIGLAIIIAAWALLADWVRQRFRRRRRCPRCWYDMSRSPTLTCSECGYAAKKERRLFKARRRWRYVWLALLLLLAGHALRITPEVRERGWVAAVPTSVLVYVAPVRDDAWEIFDLFNSGPLLGDAKDPLLIELRLRAAQRELTLWQWHVFLDRVFRKHPNSLAQTVETRDQWPAGMPVAVQFFAPWFAFSGDDEDVIIRARLAGTDEPWRERVFGVWGGELTREERVPRLGTPPSDASEIRLDIEILLGARVSRPSRTSPSIVDRTAVKRIWAGQSHPIRIAGRIEDVMKSYTTAYADGEILDLSPNLVRDGEGGLQLRLRTSSWHLGGQEDSVDWSLGLAVEVRRDGQPVARAAVLYPMVELGVHATRFASWETFDLEWIEEPPGQLTQGQWKIVLRGDPAVALYDLRRDTYWAGEVAVPAVVDTKDRDWR
ncbi:MAG: hypothetical protein SYC29_09475 [Planctomycetota bacterium]|nr:hypothetical protein [Planctomycetota bacterium]